jgi:hypothetical protein
MESVPERVFGGSQLTTLNHFNAIKPKLCGQGLNLVKHSALSASCVLKRQTAIQRNLRAP